MTNEYKGVEQYFKMVESSASYFCKQLNMDFGNNSYTSEIYGDMYQTGMVALLETWKRYDASSGNTFVTYAFYRIRGSILDYLRSLDTVDKEMRRKIKAVLEKQRLEEDKLTEEDQRILKHNVKIINMLSDGTEGAETQSAEITRAVAATDASIEQFMAKDFVSSLAIKAGLSELQRRIINDYYLHDKTCVEISREVNVARQHITFQHKKALGKLNRFLVRQRELNGLK